MRLQGKQIAWNLGKDRSIKKEIGCELLLTWMRPWKENRAPPTTHPHPYPQLASENCFNKLLKFVWGTVSTEWLRIMAKREVSMNSQYFLHRLRTVLTRIFGGKWKPEKTFFLGQVEEKAAAASAVSRKNSPATKASPLWNKSLTPPGERLQSLFSSETAENSLKRKTEK